MCSGYLQKLCCPVFSSIFLSQNIFPIPKQLAFSVIIDDRKGLRVRFLLQCLGCLLTWCSTPTWRVCAPSSSPPPCSHHNSSPWRAGASLTSAAAPPWRPPRSSAQTAEAARSRPLVPPRALMSASLSRSANWKKLDEKMWVLLNKRMMSVFVTMDRNPNS